MRDPRITKPKAGQVLRIVNVTPKDLYYIREDIHYCGVEWWDDLKPHPKLVPNFAGYDLDKGIIYNLLHNEGNSVVPSDLIMEVE